MNQQYFILFEEFKQHENSIIKMSKITEIHIMNLWINRSEEKVDDLSKLIYSHDAPLYQKMIWRFRQTKSPAFLYNGIDPCNRKKLLASFDLDQWTIQNRFGNRILEFFVWLKSSYHPQLTEFTDRENAEKHLDDWKENEMVFFINLSQDNQKILINTYNEYYKNFNI